MIVITAKTGGTYIYKSEPVLVHRTLQFMPNDPSEFKDEDLYDVLWDIAGNLIHTVEYESTYHRPDGRMSRAYRIYFLTGKDILYGKTAVNALLAKIEEAISARLPIDMGERKTMVKNVPVNLSHRRRSRLKPVS